MKLVALNCKGAASSSTLTLILGSQTVSSSAARTRSPCSVVTLQMSCTTFWRVSNVLPHQIELGSCHQTPAGSVGGAWCDARHCVQIVFALPDGVVLPVGETVAPHHSQCSGSTSA